MSSGSLPGIATACPTPRSSSSDSGDRQLVTTALFAGTLFLSAGLMFLVQPMVARLVLPLLGGTPAVWNTCVVFFQSALLAGYAYSHLTVRWLGVRRQAAVHIAVMALPIVALPIGIDSRPAPDGDTNAPLWLLGTLLSAAGLPFLAVSTTAPLLQRWFGATDHPQASDPFFLYAASSLGSLGAVIAYPVLVEPLFRLADQARWWSAGYAVLLAAVAACAVRVMRSPAATDTDSGVADARTAGPVPWRIRLRWMTFAAVPSSLMLSVTTYISTDIASVPLLWVVPLALYLLTFAIAFSRKPIITFEWANAFLPLLIIAPAITMVMWNAPPMAGIPFHLAAFFVAALMCHGRLARERPSIDHLTEYYLWISIGGAAGGLFNTLSAPLLFVSTTEYPLGLIAACLLRAPSSSAGAPNARLPKVRGASSKGTTARASRWPPLVIDMVVAVAIAALTLALLALANRRPPAGAAWLDADWFRFARTFALPFGAVLALWRTPSRFALALGAVLLANTLDLRARSPVIAAERTFFGHHYVIDLGGFRTLFDGTTSHGSQSRDPTMSCEPTTYFTRSGPVGQVFESFASHGPKRVGVVGLGSGSMAALSRAGQAWTFFEINPAVVRIASDRRYFTYLSDCIDDYQVVIGDARVNLTRVPDASFDVLVLDAFSSDAIPIHLITTEAMDLYLRKLALDGVLAVHVSNRYLNLEPVLAAQAARLSLDAWSQTEPVPVTPESRRVNKASSTWVVLARPGAAVAGVEDNLRWKRPAADPDTVAWTDDFADVLGAVDWTR